MHWLIHTFNKSFVNRFYQAHLLAFLFFTLAMFGMADGNTLLHFHYYILLTSFSGPFTLFCIWMLWLLYAANVLRYVISTLNKEEFQFLFTSNNANSWNLLKALSWAITQMNAPVLIYGLIGVVIACMHGFLSNALLGLLGLFLIVVIPASIVYHRLISIHKSRLSDHLPVLPAVHFKPGMLSILLRHITYDNKAALIGTKLFSCAVIYGAHYEWASFNYDIRWMQVAMAISIPAQGILLYQVWAFETSHLKFTRNFPVDMVRRYLSILYLVIILLTPEATLLASYCFRFHILWQLPVFLLYAVSLPMLLYAMLFTRGFNQESFNGFLFAIGLVTFFITLFGYTWLLALAFLPISYLVYKESFYQFDA